LVFIHQDLKTLKLKKMSEPYYAEIRIMPYSFAPRGWALCNGDLLLIAEYTALYSLLGTTYGGDGRVNFALPNLRYDNKFRAPMHPGRGPGLTSRRLGQMTGAPTHTLTEDEMPNHTHNLQISRRTAAEFDTPASNALPHVLKVDGANKKSYIGVPDPSKNVQMSAAAIQNSGGSHAHENNQPFLVLNYFIALTGIYPSRS
jgi:microcystin-dependent protein